jgi:jasmonate O-methyltransferase
LIEKEKVDSFNAPYYAPSMDEVEKEITNEGSFTIKKMVLFEACYDALLEDQYFEEEKKEETQITPNGKSNGGNQLFPHHKARRYAELTARTNRAVLEPMIRSHFGGEIMEELFRRYRDLLEEYYCRNKAELTNMLVALERK